MNEILRRYKPTLGAALVAGWLLSLSPQPARAVDHNNIDAGRPLSFDDAESIAFREQSLEAGITLSAPRGSKPGTEMQVEYLYGFALNSHASVGVHPSVGGRVGSNDTRFDRGNVELSLFHNLNRELGKTPALSLRADAHLPTGRGSRGVDFRLRGIASKSVTQYGRLHLNVDLDIDPGAQQGNREFTPGLILGYSQPLGYPRRFDRTGVAELAVRGSSQNGQGPIVSAGIGLRQQVGVQSVFDIGLQTDLAGSRGAPRERLRLTVGYSRAF